MLVYLQLPKRLKFIEWMQSVNISRISAKYYFLKQLPIYSIGNAVPDILIGLYNLHIIQPSQFISKNHHEPSAVRTPLGWILYGNIGMESESWYHCHSIFKTQILEIEDMGQIFFHHEW